MASTASSSPAPASSALHTLIVGGGAAGFFAAANLGESCPGHRITLVERSAKVLEKVRISGGSRCNVTHAEYDPRQLVKAYPRGEKALKGPFHTFAAGDTVGWFHDRGIALKTEDDGRMFPTTDDSMTIVNCLRDSALRAGVRVRTRAGLADLAPSAGKWVATLEDGERIVADRVLLAPGSTPKLWALLESLGHKVVPPVPSLFTFRCKDERILHLPGLSVDPAEVRVSGTKLRESGPLLITHWGFSGPAILRTSAWGARQLADLAYDFELLVNWVPKENPESMAEALLKLAREHGKRQVLTRSEWGLPLRLWKSLGEAAEISEDLRWADLSKKLARTFAEQLCRCSFRVQGKSTFKEEFVTAGGIDLREINFKTMESKLLPGIFFAGEFIDIDAITGGYNFQAAWTTAFLAAKAIAQTINC